MKSVTNLYFVSTRISVIGSEFKVLTIATQERVTSGLSASVSLRPCVVKEKCFPVGHTHRLDILWGVSQHTLDTEGVIGELSAVRVEASTPDFSRFFDGRVDLFTTLRTTSRSTKFFADDVTPRCASFLRIALKDVASEFTAYDSMIDIVNG